MTVRTDQISALVTRLEKAERQYHRLKWATLVTLLVAGGAMAIDQVRPAGGQTRPISEYRDTILIGSKTLSLGMPENEAVRTLKTDYVLREAPMAPDASDQVWIVCKQRSVDDCPVEVIFAQGKLESVDLTRGPDDAGQGAALADAAYYAIADFVREGRRACSIDAELNDSEHIVAKTASIRCGQKYISIHITEIKGSHPSAWVAEGLGPQR